MKKIMFLSFVLFLFIFSNGRSQIDTKPFEEFIGKWEGIYDVEGYKNK